MRQVVMFSKQYQETQKYYKQKMIVTRSFCFINWFRTLKKITFGYNKGSVPHEFYMVSQQNHSANLLHFLTRSRNETVGMHAGYEWGIVSSFSIPLLSLSKVMRQNHRM